MPVPTTEVEEGHDRFEVAVHVGDPLDLGAEFLRWEVATAIAGHVLGIDPFDEPNVTESKENTEQVLSQLPLPEVPADDRSSDARPWLEPTVRPGDYVSIQAYLPYGQATPTALEHLRRNVRDSHGGVAVTAGYGPRFLHSTGQLHKGGPNSGGRRADRDPRRRPADVAIPGYPYDFGTLIAAQAIGDHQSLRPTAAGCCASPSTTSTTVARSAELPCRASHDETREHDEDRHGRSGPMGGNMTQRLLEHGHEVVAYDRNSDAVKGGRGRGRRSPSTSLEELVGKLDGPAAGVGDGAGRRSHRRDHRHPGRSAWRRATSIIDGGNSNYKARPAAVGRAGAERGSRFIDAGTSGGVWGLKNGYCLMVGGDAEAVARVEPVFIALAPEDGYAHVGPVGRRPLHEDGPQRHRVRDDAGLRRGLRHHGRGRRVRRSTCTRSPRSGATARWCARGCSSWPSWRWPTRTTSTRSRATSRTRARAAGRCRRPSTARWPAPVITASLFERFSSRQADSFAARIVAALRNEFGGHRLSEPVPRKWQKRAPAGDDAGRPGGGGHEARRSPAAGAALACWSSSARRAT